MTMACQDVGVEVAAIDGETAARSTLYQLFSHLFSYPTAELLEEWFGKAEATFTGLGPLPDMDIMAARYTALFDNCTGRARIPLRESPYLRTEARAIWEDLVRFYEHFGLEFSVDETRLWPDHLTVQLDMMHYLTFLQAAGGPEPVLQHAQRDFLERHLLNWIDNFHQALLAAEDSAPYGDLAGRLVEFLREDFAYLVLRKEEP